MVDKLKFGSENVKYYSLPRYAEEYGFDLSRVPVAIKILMENLLRKADSGFVSPEDLKALAEWEKTRGRGEHDINFHPGRVVMQDFTGVPAVVDLAGDEGRSGRGGEEILQRSTPSYPWIWSWIIRFRWISMPRLPPIPSMSRRSLRGTASATAS